MNREDFEACWSAELADQSLQRITKRFNAAFRRTRDIDSAMAAVNELLESPMSYRELLHFLRD